jgi:leader peptidase (prepilin peptidase)/N-methyltransferase
MDTLFPHPYLVCIVAALMGLQLGSFLNVVVWRLPLMMQRQWEAECAELQGATNEPAQEPFNLSAPRSHCPACKTPLRAADLVPVLSYLWLRGKCAHCGVAVSVRYPLVELAVALLWGICAWRWGFSVEALAWAGFGSVLLALALIDADTMLLPDSLTLPLLWAGILCASFGVIQLPLLQSVWGAAAGYGVLWAVQAVFKLITGKQGMGEGDYKLLAALGAWLGWMVLPMVVLIASLLGVVLALGMRWRGSLKVGEPLPFGPYLVVAGLVCATVDLHSGLYSF